MNGHQDWLFSGRHVCVCEVQANIAGQLSGSRPSQATALFVDSRPVGMQAISNQTKTYLQVILYGCPFFKKKFAVAFII